MATIEKLIVQIFDRKRQIIEQLKQQKLLYNQHLASKLLIQGIAPPSWLLPSDFPPSSAHLSALDKAGLISGLLHPRPGPAAFCPDGRGFLYDRPVSAVNDSVADEACAGNCASSPGCDEDGSSVDPLCQVDDTEDGAGIVHPTNVEAIACALSYAPMSPDDQSYTRICSTHPKQEQSFAKIQRSRSRQKALEVRNSAKTSGKSRLGITNDVGTHSQNKSCPGDEQLYGPKEPLGVVRLLSLATEICHKNEGSIEMSDALFGLLPQSEDNEAKKVHAGEDWKKDKKSSVYGRTTTRSNSRCQYSVNMASEFATPGCFEQLAGSREILESHKAFTSPTGIRSFQAAGAETCSTKRSRDECNIFLTKSFDFQEKGVQLSDDRKKENNSTVYVGRITRSSSRCQQFKDVPSSSKRQGSSEQLDGSRAVLGSYKSSALPTEICSWEEAEVGSCFTKESCDANDASLTKSAYSKGMDGQTRDEGAKEKSICVTAGRITASTIGSPASLGVPSSSNTSGHAKSFIDVRESVEFGKRSASRLGFVFKDEAETGTRNSETQQQENSGSNVLITTVCAQKQIPECSSSNGRQRITLEPSKLLEVGTDPLSWELCGARIIGSAVNGQDALCCISVGPNKAVDCKKSLQASSSSIDRQRITVEPSELLEVGTDPGSCELRGARIIGSALTGQDALYSNFSGPNKAVDCKKSLQASSSSFDQQRITVEPSELLEVVTDPGSLELRGARIIGSVVNDEDALYSNSSGPNKAVDSGKSQQVPSSSNDRKRINVEPSELLEVGTDPDSWELRGARTIGIAVNGQDGLYSNSSGPNKAVDCGNSLQAVKKLKFSIVSPVIERMDVDEADQAMPEFERFGAPNFGDERLYTGVPFSSNIMEQTSLEEKFSSSACLINPVSPFPSTCKSSVSIGLSKNPETTGSLQEQLCSSACLSTPKSPFPAACNLYLEPGIYSSVPNGLLENIDLRSDFLPVGSALQRKSQSDLFSFPRNQFGLEFRKPFLSPTGKGFESITSKSGGSEKLTSGNPELTCFTILEDPESSEEDVNVAKTGVEEVHSSMKRSSVKELLCDVTQKNRTSLVQDHEVEDRRSDSTSTDIVVSEICNVDSQANAMSHRRSTRTTRGKENKGFSVGGNSFTKNSKALSSRFSKPKLTGQTALKSRGQSMSEKEPKRHNIVSNVKSFIPLVQQKQALATAPVKRDVKVKALEAAEAAKRLAEKKEDERKQKKEALKNERVRLEQEKLKQTELAKQLKVEAKKKREAENAVKKRQREEEEKKEREKKRKRVEDARCQQKQAEEKLHAWREELRYGAEEERTLEGKEINIKAQNEFNTATEASISIKPMSELVNGGSVRTETSDGIPTSNTEPSLIGKIDSIITAESSTPNFNKSDKPISRISEEQSYDISPYQCSDDEEEDDDEIPNKKFIPSWASKSCVSQALSSQQHMDPDTIFAPGSFCSLEEVLVPRRLPQDSSKQ